MIDDPIVREVRKAREEIAAEEGYDLHRLAERFRREQAAHPERVVRMPPRIHDSSDLAGTGPSVQTGNKSER